MLIKSADSEMQPIYPETQIGARRSWPPTGLFSREEKWEASTASPIVR